MTEKNITAALATPVTLLSDQLKEKTKTQHQLLEKQIIPLIKSIRTTEDYSRLLMLFYTFFGGLELLADKTMDVNFLPDYLQRRKLASLSYDLHAMNVALHPLANGNDLPQIENHLHAFGALYVMEGSTLGGQQISKMISGQLMQDNALSFFNGYKSETQKMWQVFKKALDAVALNNIEEAVVINAANDSFSKFSSWIIRC